MTDSTPTPSGGNATRIRTLSESPALAAHAAALLATPGAMLELSEADARSVVAQMTLINLKKGSVIYSEGDAKNVDHMLLLLTGEVSVDMADLGRADAVSVSVLGPGNFVGEMGLLDGLPRSTTCVAVTDVTAAVLARPGLTHLIENEPQVAVRFLIAIGQRMADRLRAMGEQLRLYARLGHTHFAPTERIKIR
jgi:CRP/FNR family transcriptional regulator, cyclic AMP receptor protein